MMSWSKISLWSKGLNHLTLSVLAATCCLLIIFANSLDRDQEPFLKKVSRWQQKHEKLPSIQRVEYKNSLKQFHLGSVTAQLHRKPTTHSSWSVSTSRERSGSVAECLNEIEGSQLQAIQSGLIWIQTICKGYQQMTFPSTFLRHQQIFVACLIGYLKRCPHRSPKQTYSRRNQKMLLLD